jgi:pyruvate formate lyase activating enzyme
VAFPDSKLDIEVDGWWHYKHEPTRETDLVRDQTLRANGWQVLRISGRHVYNHREEVKALIVQHLASPSMLNKRTWLDVTSVKPTEHFERVYSFECIPNHTYVGDGIILHNCSYCQNAGISQRRKVEGTDLMPPDVVGLALSHGCQGIAYTYNQPTIFMEFARDIGVEARRNGLINIFVSNGYDTPNTVNMMNDFLDCITIDFKGNAETGFVRKYIGIANAEPIYQTILELRDKTKTHMEFTDLIVPEVGDNLDEARKLSRWLYDNLGPDLPIHFLRFHPDYKMMNVPSTPVKTLEQHCRIAREEGLRYVYVGNVPGHPWEHTYCPECKAVAIKRYGFDITGWNLDENNQCINCGYALPIVGHLSSSVSKERFLPVVN